MKAHDIRYWVPEEVARLPGVRESGATEFTAGSLLPSRREIAAGPCPTVLEVLLIE